MKPRHFRIAAFAIGGVAVAGAAVLVTASAAGLNVGFRSASPNQPNTTDATALAQTSTTASAVCTDFVSHFAGDLGTSQAKVNAAFQKAVAETLADQVKSGAITQKQADSIAKKLAGKAPCSLAAGIGKTSGGHANLGRYLKELENAAASALGISETELKADLAKGMTLSQIAAAQKPPVTESQFRTRLIAQLTPLLDAAVKSQKLSAAQEQMIIKRIQSGPIPFWNIPMTHKPSASGTAPASPSAST